MLFSGLLLSARHATRVIIRSIQSGSVKPGWLGWAVLGCAWLCVQCEWGLMNEKRKLKWDSGNAFNETHTVCVILIPKHVVTKETNIFAAMCKVTCLRIIECGLTISVYVCVCICMCVYICIYMCVYVPGTSVGIATDYGLHGPDRIPVGTRFSARPDRPCGPPSHLQNGYRVFSGGKVRSGRAADHSPPPSATVMEE